MAKKIAFINFKGGVGKTTLTAELASRLVYEYNKKVLLIDTDPQTNLTFYFIEYKDWENYVKLNGSLKNLFESYIQGGLTPQIFDLNKVIMKDFYINDKTKKHTLQNLSLIPAHLEMMKIEADLAYEIGRRVGDISQNEKLKGLKRYHETLHILKNALLSIENDYDFIFFDCPPSIGLLTQNALVASDKYIVPVIPDYLSTVGLQFLKRQINEMVDRINKAKEFIGDNNFYNGPKRSGIIFTRVRVWSWGPPLELVSPQDIIFNRLKNDKEFSNILFKNFMSESARVQESAEDKIPVAIRTGKKYEESREQIKELTKEFLLKV